MCAVEAGGRGVVDVRDLRPRRALKKNNLSDTFLWSLTRSFHSVHPQLSVLLVYLHSSSHLQSGQELYIVTKRMR